MALSLGIKGGSAAMNDPKMMAARAKVFAAVKANHMFFLNTVNANNVVEKIKEGVMIGAGNAAAADVGRKFTNRQMP
jgi:hypothetical protein